MLNKTYSLKSLCVSCWTAYILQDDTRSLQYQVSPRILLVQYKNTFSYTTDVVFRDTVTKETSLNIDIKIFNTGYTK